MDVLSKEKFQASNWLDIASLSSPLRPRLNLPLTLTTRSSVLPQEKESFFPPEFLVTGWQGDSLITRAGLSVRNIMQELLPSAQACFEKAASNFGRSRSLAIYQEFLSFEQDQQHQAPEIDSPAAFWQHLRQGAHSPYAADLKEFTRLYAIRTIIVYAFKIRFITHLCQALAIPVAREILRSPQSFLAKIFKAGSSTELMSAALRTGAYSWYLPQAAEENLAQQLAQNLRELSLNELIKVCTYVPGKKGMEDPHYSHTLSHREFGVFLQQLLVAFPGWMDKNGDDGAPQAVLNCHLAGDYVTAISLANWLAQEKFLQQDPANFARIISPHLAEDSFASGTFAQACQELQFLTFLAQAATTKHCDPVKFICEVMRQRYAALPQGQMSMFPEWESKSTQVYQRSILNVASLPAKNPHYYLLQQIQGQLDLLAEHGRLYVFSNQNLFVPSQSDKLERLLQKVNLDAYFNFEELKGRGEIPAFLYILTKSKANKNAPRTWGEQQLTATCTRQKACASFKWSGALKTFYNFQDLGNAFRKFLAEHDPQATWVYQENVGGDLTFEFNQDAIIDGRFLSSQNDDPRKITHPKFFRNLVNSCVTLDHFFQMEQIRPDDFSSPLTTAQELLGVPTHREVRYPLAIIVDYSGPSIRLELVERDALRGKMEKYGQAFFQYFGLLPKTTNININIFREFFQTDLGEQIIQLGLAGGPTKMKAKLAALLIPKFFLHTQLLPSAAPTAFAHLSAEEILASDSTALQNLGKTAAVLAEQYQGTYPWHVLAELAEFKYQTFLALSSLREGRAAAGLNFQHPVILKPLLQAKLQEIYPRNQDLFVDFNLQNPQDIHRPLEQITLASNGQNYVLRLYSNDMEILKLYGPQNVLQFLEFIFQQAKGISISQLLAQTKTPAAADLDKIIENFKQVETALAVVYQQLSGMISAIILRHLSGRQEMSVELH